MIAKSPRIFFSYPNQSDESDCACPEAEISASLPGKEAESDCACPTEEVSLQGILPNGGLWRLSPSLYRSHLAEGYQLVFNPMAPGTVVVLNSAAIGILDSYTVPGPLTNPTARELSTLGLLIPTEDVELGRRVANRVLTVWLHTTTRCNLHCAYCYAPRGREDMGAEVGRAAVDAVFRSARIHGFAAVKIKYAGGEPTLNFPTIQAIHDYAQQQAERGGIDLHEVLLSNGVALTEPILRWLRDEGVRLSVSLDGIGVFHDRQRPRGEEGGSYTAVAAAVDRACEMGIVPHLSITVTRRNVGNLAAVAAFALERGLPFNLNFVRPVPDTPDLAPPTDHLLVALQEVIEVLEHLSPPYRAIDNILDRCDISGPHRYPCGVGRSYLVVGPKGDVARCHMEMQRSVSTVWEEDPLGAVQTKIEGVRNPPVEAKAPCRSCLWRYICAGGCPLTARRTTGRENAPSPYCAVYRKVLPELLRVEGMRLLEDNG